MTRSPLTAIAFVAIGLLTNLNSSLAQLNTPQGYLRWTFSEKHAWDASARLPSGDAAKEYIRNAPAPELPPPERLPYFVRHLNSLDPSIAHDALHEVSLADVKHFSTLPLPDSQLLKAYIIRPTTDDEFRFGLDRLIAGYLLAEGGPGLDAIDESILKDQERSFSDVYAAMIALRFLWSSDDNSIEKERLRESLRLLIDRPELADLVIADLARWEDWSVQDKLVSLYGTGEFDLPSIKRAIIRYLLTSIRDVPADRGDDVPEHIARGREHLEALRQQDPETYESATRFASVFRPAREPKQGRFDAWGDFAPVASTLSGIIIYTKAIHTVVFSPDGETLLSGSGDGSLGWWDVDSGELTGAVKAHSTWCFSIAFHPEGEEIATGGGDQLVNLWGISNRMRIASLDEHADDVHAVAYDLTGRKLFSAGDDMSVIVSDRSAMTVIRRLEGHTEPIPCLAVSPDGSLIATGSRDDTIRLWDAATGESRHVLNEHTGDVHSVAFSPNGKILASASYDETVKLWNVESGELINTLRGHTNWVFSVAFHPNGDLLASGDKDGRIILWDTNSGEELATLKRQRHVSCVAFSPDGSILASSSPDATICLWDPHARTLQKALMDTDVTSLPPR